MRKLLLLIPVGLFAMTGIFWVSMYPSMSGPDTSRSAQAESYNEQELFARSETSLRQIVRRGDTGSVETFQRTLDSLSRQLEKRSENDHSIQKIETMLALYRQDGTLLAQTIAPHMEQLRRINTYEHANEKKFLASLDQIGLYELITAFDNLDKLRNEYVKTPSDDTANRYRNESKRITAIISELYLDSSIENPLYEYLNNHKTYFETIHVAYRSVGYDRIDRIRINGYAIRSAFQLLPTS